MQDPRQALAGTVALLAATVAALCALALADPGSESVVGSAPPPPPPPPATALDPERLLELGIESTPRVARGVEAIRELRFREVPVPEISDVARLRRLAQREIERPATQRQLAIAEAELRLLGLLDAGQSLGEVASDVTAGAAAYYEPRRDELFLVGDAVPAGPELAEFVLAHELTHALEDQRFGLPRAGGVSDDEELASSALVEGTATAVMVEYASRHLNPLALAAEIAGLDTGAAGELPRFAEAEVTFVYREGMRFVEELVGLGGWTVIDYAYTDRPPATTEQVLHPEKYLEDERPLPVPAPPVPGPGWKVVDTSELGEFGTQQVLRAGELGLGADAGAAGWGGDRFLLFARRGAGRGCAEDCRSTHALALRWRGDDVAEARELAHELRRYVMAGLGGVAAGEGAWQLDGGAAAVASAGDVAGLGLAPDVATARRLAAPR